jgi:Holliday junction resolvasome RuvABC endonuclease subunit
MSEQSNVVLAIYPNARVIGYACVEWPEKILDSGLAAVWPIYHGKLLKRVIRFIDFYKPALIVIRTSDNSSRSTTRAQKLSDEVSEYANGINLPVYRYTREQVKDVFEQFGAGNKHDMAKRITEWRSELKWFMPKLRETGWDEENNMAIFDAFSLIVTHKYLNE